MCEIQTSPLIIGNMTVVTFYRFTHKHSLIFGKNLTFLFFRFLCQISLSPVPPSSKDSLNCDINNLFPQKGTYSIFLNLLNLSLDRVMCLEDGDSVTLAYKPTLAAFTLSDGWKTRERGPYHPPRESETSCALAVPLVELPIGPIVPSFRNNFNRSCTLFTF